MRPFASLALPLLVLTAAITASSALYIAYSLVRSRPRHAKVATLAALTWLVGYVGIVTGVALSSDGRVLGMNEPKRFCGFYLDCHVMITLRSVDTASTIGEGASAIEAEGVFYIVTVEHSSDAVAATIGLTDAEAVVRDAFGHRFTRSERGEVALAEADGQPLLPIGLPLEAGSAYTTRLVFDLPGDVVSPVLLVAERDWLTRLSELFLIGDDDSMLHPQTVFRLAV